MANDAQADNPTSAVPTTHAVVWHLGTEAAFLAKFPGRVGNTALDVTVSQRVSETVKATTQNYDDEPVIVFDADATTQLMLPQELSDSAGQRDVFQCTIQTGIPPARAVEGRIERAGDTHRLEATELLIRRPTMPGTQTLTVTPYTSNVLDTQGGTAGSPTTVPDIDADIVKAPVGANETGRFVGFKLQGTNVNAIIRYLGAYLRGHRVT